MALSLARLGASHQITPISGGAGSVPSPVGMASSLSIGSDDSAYSSSLRSATTLISGSSRGATVYRRATSHGTSRGVSAAAVAWGAPRIPKPRGIPSRLDITMDTAVANRASHGGEGVSAGQAIITCSVAGSRFTTPRSRPRLLPTSVSRGTTRVLSITENAT